MSKIPRVWSCAVWWFWLRRKRADCCGEFELCARLNTPIGQGARFRAKPFSLLRSAEPFVATCFVVVARKCAGLEFVAGKARRSVG